jgi:hypothetical protein
MIAKPSRYFWIILLALLTACGQVPPETTPTATLTPLPPTVTSMPTITSTPEPQQPPTCTFPLAGTTMEESKPEAYTFSEPVIAANSNSGIELVEWLPDSQRILITRRIYNTSNENIELLDPVTGETQVYAVRTGNMWFRPVWVENLKSVIYSDWLLVSSPTYNNGMVVPTSIVGRQQLMLTVGNPDNTQILEDVQFQYLRQLGGRNWLKSWMNHAQTGDLLENLGQ